MSSTSDDLQITATAMSDARLESFEERAFIGCLMCILGHFQDQPSMGPKTTQQVCTMVDKAMKKTKKGGPCAQKFGSNVEIWLFLYKIFFAAVRRLQIRALGKETTDAGSGYPNSTHLIIRHHESLRKDLEILGTLTSIAESILRCETKTVAQELCAAASFYEATHDLLRICVHVNTITKGPDETCANTSPEALDNVIDIHELCMQPYA